VGGVPVPLADALAHQRFAVVDVETSGLSPVRHRILQVAVVEVQGDGTVLDEWTTLVRPSWWRVGPRHVHGLTVRRVWRAPKLARVAPELVARLDGRVIVAHNMAFDWAFIERGLGRAGVHPGREPLRLCTLELSRALDPERTRSHRLGDLCRQHGIVLERAHDALADARAGRGQRGRRPVRATSISWVPRCAASAPCGARSLSRPAEVPAPASPAGR
jgi:DNA polymerase III subunit epsilon